MRTHLLHACLVLISLAVIGVIFFPSPIRARHSPRQASCQSNLKQIGLAVMQYSQDYDKKLPTRQWGKSVLTYAKTEEIFQCAETTKTKGSSDYFFNARFLGTPLPRISSPKTPILMGDGKDAAPLGATLTQLPPNWIRDEKSPSWRHLDGANYGFADGHVKWIKVNGSNRNFRVGQR